MEDKRIMAKFNEKDIQKIGSVEVSASKLRALATKIEEVYKTAENVEVDMYLVPSGAKKTFAFDFPTEAPKAGDQPAPAGETKPAGDAPTETKPAEGQPATPPADAKPAEATPATETKPAETKPTEEKK